VIPALLVAATGMRMHPTTFVARMNLNAKLGGTVEPQHEQQRPPPSAVELLAEAQKQREARTRRPEERPRPSELGGDTATLPNSAGKGTLAAAEALLAASAGVFQSRAADSKAEGEAPAAATRVLAGTGASATPPLGPATKLSRDPIAALAEEAAAWAAPPPLVATSSSTSSSLQAAAGAADDVRRALAAFPEAKASGEGCFASEGEPRLGCRGTCECPWFEQCFRKDLVWADDNGSRRHVDVGTCQVSMPLLHLSAAAIFLVVLAGVTLVVGLWSDEQKQTTDPSKRATLSINVSMLKQLRLQASGSAAASAAAERAGLPPTLGGSGGGAACESAATAPSGGAASSGLALASPSAFSAPTPPPPEGEEEEFEVADDGPAEEEQDAILLAPPPPPSAAAA